ncbi:glycosyltransferase family 2 protein [Leptolyngbya sp. Cla-17]|uniref:glycosyltransferase family 2 protein n=1 Tax=Leptolyngbya sp. Cla-17 TaxID=2803751 RepID=UPI001F5DECD5|nr:glycosyltransferase family 2 protein [Leptolyngbya sp. Cla-17]
MVLLIVETVLLAISILLLIPSFVLMVECVAALFPPRAWRGQNSERSRIAVLIPAHNEAAGIGATLETLIGQLTSPDQLVVVADNCTDETAAVARETGAIAIERFDDTHRGKGYALDFGMSFLANHPPDVVVIVDADCIVAPGAIEQISRLAIARNRAVQATYLLVQPANPSPKDAVSTLAFTVKNLVRPLGLARFDLPCPLTGTGMAFPWAVIRKVSLASGNIVEDMNLGLDLAIAGHPATFCHEARVTSALPQQASAAKSQRTRWEHGHLQTILTQVPRLLKVSLQKRRFDLLAIALDLLIPPLSLLVMLWALAMTVALVAIYFGISQTPAIVLGSAGVMILAAIVSAWAKYCRAAIPAKVLFTIPLYVLWKIPLYFRFLWKPQTKWIRTERDSVDSSRS